MTTAPATEEAQKLEQTSTGSNNANESTNDCTSIPGMSCSSSDQSQAASQRQSSFTEQIFYEAQLKTFSQEDALNDTIKNQAIYEHDSQSASDTRTFSYQSQSQNDDEDDDEMSEPDIASVCQKSTSKKLQHG